jgi:hypothetical protein
MINKIHCTPQKYTLDIRNELQKLVLAAKLKEDVADT